MALSDPFKDRLDETKQLFAKHNPRVYQGIDSYKEVLESDVDGVAIVGPPYFHPEQGGGGYRKKESMSTWRNLSRWMFRDV